MMLVLRGLVGCACKRRSLAGIPYKCRRSFGFSFSLFLLEKTEDNVCDPGTFVCTRFTSFSRRRRQQEKLIRRLDQEFLACARRYGLPLGDFPKVQPTGSWLRDDSASMYLLCNPKIHAWALGSRGV